MCVADRWDIAGGASHVLCGHHPIPQGYQVDSATGEKASETSRHTDCNGHTGGVAGFDPCWMDRCFFSTEAQ